MTARIKEILIAVLLVACMLLGVAAVFFMENKAGTPDYYNGEMQSIKVDITEICSANSALIATDNGDFPDYIELYNSGDSFNLADFGLSNSTDNSICYTFGDIEFPSGTYLLLYLDGNDIPFKLNSGGNEYVALVSWDGTVIDSVTTVATKSNQVMLRTQDGYEVSDLASPGYPNTDEGRALFVAGDIDGEMDIAVNEIFISNQNVLPDFQGDYCDIIEIKNISKAVVSTKGYFISDDASDRAKCPLPEKTLAPGELMLIFASGKDKMAENGEFHSNFKISAGETLTISVASKYRTHEVFECEDNISQSIVANSDVFEKMVATPGFSNDEAGMEELENSRIYKDAPIVISELLFAGDEISYGGKLRDVIEICNVSGSEFSTKGWFISDSENDPYKYQLPEKTLAPNECMVLYAEKSEEPNATGFGLSTGESVYLTAPDFRRSEYVNCASAGDGKSRSLVYENGEALYINSNISIGFPNGEQGEVLYSSSVRPAEVEISEIVPANKAYVPGPYKTYFDFIELHNRTDKDIDLSDWYLSDDTKQPFENSLAGITIPANGYVVIILTSETLNLPEGYPVLNFSVASSGEALVLSKGNMVVETVIMPSMADNTSYGKAKDSDVFSVLEVPTPGEENSGVAIEVAASPVPSLPQGVYKEPEITVELQGEGNIYYTLDCTEPNAGSTLYTSPIKLTSTTVIRCFSVVQGKKTGKITDLTYIVNEPDSLEVVSLVTTPDNLFNEYTGIYATGHNANAEFPYEGANYYNRWEREASVSFFDKNGGGFSEKCGIRIFGGLSRALPKKSLGCFFRSAYGSGELNYKLFEDRSLASYECFVLRNTGQDWRMSAMRDAMITSLAYDYLGIDVQACRPVVLYINGEYWGIYFIREKLNEHYVAGHYNVSANEAEVTFANGRTSDNYLAMVDYAASNDLSVKANYDYICTLMDVENYADYIVAEIIIGNADNGNIRFFNYKGGKWRWMMYDVDHGFRSYTQNTVSLHLNPAGTGASNMFSTRLINSLLKNPDFKKMFLEEIAYQLENVWTSEIICAYVDEFEGYIINDIQRDFQRWDHDYYNWVSSVQSLRDFANNRESYVENHVKAYFNLSDEEMRSYGFDI